MSWITKLEQRTANVLKKMYMDKQRLMEESESEITKWESQIESEKRFLAKIAADTARQAEEQAKKAAEQAAALAAEAQKFRQKAQKYSRDISEIAAMPLSSATEPRPAAAVIEPAVAATVAQPIMPSPAAAAAAVPEVVDPDELADQMTLESLLSELNQLNRSDDNDLPILTDRVD